MSSIASLRRKDNMWIYKNPQGLQVLNDELNERRKKRSARTRYTPTPNTVLSPPLSPTMEKLIPIVSISQITTEPRQRPPSPAEEKLIEETKIFVDKPLKPINQWKQKSMEDKNIKKLSVITSTVQEKKNALQLSSKQENNTVSIKPNKTSSPPAKTDKVTLLPIRAVSTPVRPATPPARADTPTTRDASSPSRIVTPPTRATSPPARVATPPVRVATPPTRPATPPARVATPPVRVASPPARAATPPTRAVIPPERVASLPKRVNSPPIPIVSTSKRTTSPMSTPEKNFLLEAKQKLFSTQQKPTNKTNVPNVSVKKNGIVSSYISAFETPINKPTKQIIMPPKSISTPLCANEPVIPSVPESYFSEVIDRRFSPTPNETEEEPIVVYLPQLSPDMSFCTNALDIADDSTRPCIKKQVSFSEQISTYIEEETISDFVRTLNTELMDVSAGIPYQQREKFIPALKNTVAPQKLSNKLLDIFQKKPKMMDQPATSQLTHLTKTRARKPPSLKKPLTYPAAIAQPDWRARAITTKKSSVLI